MEIYGSNAIIRIIGCTFTNINGSKGCIEIHNVIPSTFIFQNNIFDNVNAISGNGAVLTIAVSNGSITITNCSFSNCNASGFGG
jgi:hypothetical protein